MAFEFLTSEWGWWMEMSKHCVFHLWDSLFKKQSSCVFKAGKNRDGHFDADDLLQQVENVIDIFESRTNGFVTGLFLFDNAPTRDERPMLVQHRKGSHATWRHNKDGPKMQPGNFGADNAPPDFYFVDNHPMMPGWFKGMEIIIYECGLWLQKGLNAQCEGFKCVAGKTDCCCHRLLFTQPDFKNQKSHLEEYITSHGHICDFYPKYHCKLNFIKQY